ncbi:MAG: Gfo/Idh/MocA family oxidoreductase [Verrucomicrobia bacterium]|nr:Gfo/Idh/MocA family oxidoreductase [Verrucomicrobiota bacterium]
MKCALLGLTHPHSGALLATLEALPDIGGVVLWENAAGAASAAAIPRSRKVEAVASDLRAVLGRDDLDFAIVCVRTDQAAGLARKVVMAGKHLLAEKPVGLTSAEIAGVMRTAERARVQAAVLYVNRVHPVVVEARRLCRAGALGPMLSYEARFITTQVRFRDPGSWLFRRRHAGGGILSWLGCHYLDLLQYISGDEVTTVSASLARRSGEKIDVEDSAALAFRFRSGAVGTFHAGYALAFSGGGYMNPAGNDSYLACNGRDGRLVWPSQQVPQLHIESAGRRPIRDKTFRFGAGLTGAGFCREAFVRQFVGAMRGENESPAPLSAALRTALIIEAAAQADRSGCTARIALGRRSAR